MAAGSNDNRVPVTLLTGFLGAGKTTLLNHLIRDPAAGRIAVIVNEFGDAGLDHDLVEEETEEIILMQSGCLCCTIRGDLVKTLVSLQERRQAGQLTFDRVVIETTGIAEPGPILHSLVVDQAVAPEFRMDGVVTLADAAMGPGTLNRQFEAVSQIAMADLIVLSKTDLVPPSALTRFQARLTGLNKTARQIRADHGRVPPGALFGLSAMHDKVTTSEMSDWLGMGLPEPDPLAGISGLMSPHPGPATRPLTDLAGPKAHDHRISSASIEVSDPIPADLFDFWLDTLISLKGPNILRIKGLVHVEHMSWPFVFHGVQHIFDAPVPLEAWSGGDKTSRVVIIARDTPKEELEAHMDLLRARSEGLGMRAHDMVVHSIETGV